MSNNIVVTIIIATYNSAKNIRVALESVQKQTFKAWECIVIDGASKDNTIEIVKEFEAKDARFRYISEPDNGIYDAYNKGWKNAQGHWVLYLGSDDELCADGLMTLMQFSNDFDVLYGDVYLKFANGTKKLQKARDTAQLKCGRKMPCCHQSMIMKKDIISSLGGFDMSYKLLADLDLCVRAIHKNYIFKKVDIVVATFSVTGASHSDISSAAEFDKIYKRYNNVIKSTFVHYLVLFKLFKNYVKHKYING